MLHLAFTLPVLTFRDGSGKREKKPEKWDSSQTAGGGGAA